MRTLLPALFGLSALIYSTLCLRAATDSALTLPVKEVTVFKDGHAFVVHEGRLPKLNESKAWLAQHTNPRKLRGLLEDALRGANVFIGVSGPGLLRAKHLKRMAPKPIIFA